VAAVVIYDACVLHPAPLRDLLIRLARAGLVQARWTDQILDECFRSILRRRPELAAPLQRTRELMIAAVPDCLVIDYEDLIESLTLPDPEDRHVLAAAIRAAARTIVTSNLRDFPSAVLARYALAAKHPDNFVVELIDSTPAAVAAIVARQAADLRSPPRTFPELLDTLQNTGLPLSVARLRELFES
jgi:predicted nucleic acid-binding protein